MQPLGTLPNIPVLFLWVLLPALVKCKYCRAKHVNEFVLASASCPWWQESVCLWCGGGIDRMGLGNSLRKGWSRAPGEKVRGTLSSSLALPVPTDSDLKDKTKVIVLGMMLGHRIFRNGRHLTTHRSHSPSPNLIKTIFVPLE